MIPTFHTLIVFIASISVQITFAKSSTSSVDFYYGAELMEQPGGDDFKDRLHEVLKRAHYPNDLDYDELNSSCESGPSRCYQHSPVTYRKAREHLFGHLHLQTIGSNEYAIQSIYCLDVLTNDDFPSDKALGPMKIPDNTILNAEHSWPQSRFTKNFPEGTQKADLHHLFPALNNLNSIRGNHPFGTVETEKNALCENTKFGTSTNGTTVFEPPMASRGNIARALFYFSVRYRTTIDPLQESELRQWHELDPIDLDEVTRANEIFKIQKVRNPFIDHPEWVNEISDF